MWWTWHEGWVSITFKMSKAADMEAWPDVLIEEHKTMKGLKHIK